MTAHKGGSPRQEFPRKGTKARAIMLLMLREEGVCANEAVEAGLSTSRGNFTSTKNYLLDFYDFDILQWCIKSPKGGRDRVKFRIIGRWCEDGKYLDYLARKMREMK